MKTCHFTLQVWNNRGVMCFAYDFDPQQLHFYYFQNWMACPIFSLGYKKKRCNREILLPRFIILSEGTSLFLYFLFFYIFVWTYITESYLAYFWNINIVPFANFSNRNIIQKNSLFTPFAKSKWHTPYYFTTKLK